MEAKRIRTASMSNEEDTAASQGSAGGGAAASFGGAVSTAVDAEVEAEAKQVGSAETEEHVQLILLAIDNFTSKVSEMLEFGRALFKSLAADFEVAVDESRASALFKSLAADFEVAVDESRASAGQRYCPG